MAVAWSRYAVGAAALFVAAAIITSAGCSSTGQFRQGTQTGVNLTQANYKVIKAGAKGDSTGFKLLGIIPIVSPNYADAKAALYQSVGEPLTGRSVALANQTEDRSSIYLIVFSIPKVTITADVIEFTDKTQGR